MINGLVLDIVGALALALALYGCCRQGTPYASMQDAVIPDHGRTIIRVLYSSYTGILTY
jgi:hypothetical protein